MDSIVWRANLRMMKNQLGGLLSGIQWALVATERHICLWVREDFVASDLASTLSSTPFDRRHFATSRLLPPDWLAAATQSSLAAAHSPPRANEKSLQASAKEMDDDDDDDVLANNQRREIEFVGQSAPTRRTTTAWFGLRSIRVRAYVCLCVYVTKSDRHFTADQQKACRSYRRAWLQRYTSYVRR